ncbi:MAG: HNH endonuclease [Notoacmeibacter sp.]|nr:HNH endonuclease [Notoacmeibacter sp.]
MRIPDFVATLLDNISEVSSSTDRKGCRNWEYIGSAERCWRCGKRFGEELEPGSEILHHLVPTSEGGSNHTDNTSHLCSNCHSVVHRYYLPTRSIGKSRTRGDKGRLVADFGGVQIILKMDDPSASLSKCEECGGRGIVVGVSEGYWGGEGMIIFLNCEDCDHAFGVPFIGTREAPAIDPISSLIRAIRSGHAAAPSLPEDLQNRSDELVEKLVEILSGFRSQINAEHRNLARAGKNEAEINEALSVVGQKYIDLINDILPEARSLAKLSRPFIKGKDPVGR